MATTYEKIATTTLGSATNTFDFTSIPATYTDLRVVFVGTETTTGFNHARLRFNSDTASNYSFTYLTGNGTAAASARNTSQTSIRLSDFGLSNTIPSQITFDVFSYASSTFKSLLSTFDGDYNGSGLVLRQVGLWRSTSAITTITILNTASNFAVGTTATLYGILKA
jgi:hypothetical protein